MYKPFFYAIVILATVTIVACPHREGYSQDYPPRALSNVYRLPANTALKKVAWGDSIYRFPSFQSGRITLATGFSPSDQLRFNYNLYFAQMDFINSDGDTLQIKPMKELKVVHVGEHAFFYDRKIGYIEILQQLPVALGVKHIMVMTHAEYASGRIAGMDDLRGTTSVYDRFYQKDRIFYFIGINNKSYGATSSSLYKMFPSDKKKISLYLKDNKIDYNNEEDLTKLIIFCNELSKDKSAE